MDRKYNIDLCRIICIFAVVLVHVNAPYYKLSVIGENSFVATNIIGALARFCVPLLLTISGSLLIGKEINIKEFYKKSLLPLFFVYYLWVFIYGMYKVYTMDYTGNIISISHYHLEFIPNLIGIYLILPIINELLKNIKVFKLLYLITFIFAIMIQSIDLFYKISIYTDRYIIPFKNPYLFYFLSGYFFRNVKSKKAILISFISLFITIIASLYKSYGGNSRVYYWGYGYINIAIITISLFAFFNSIDMKNKFLNVIILNLSKNSFAIYLVHVFFVDLIIKYLGFIEVPFIIKVPLFTVISFIASYLFVLLINLILPNKLKRFILYKY